MATPLPTPCRCSACSLRRLTAPLVLIALGGLLLARMLTPAFTTAALVGIFLVFVGLLGMARHAAPRPANHYPPGSLFFPLLLLVVGGLMLVAHWLPEAPLGAWIANYWPVLLIVWGLMRLVEHYTRPPQMRSGLGGGEIFLLIVIIVCGLAFSGTYRFAHSRLANYWGVNVAAWNPFLRTYSYSASAHAGLPAAAAGATVVIRGYRGDIRLQPGDASSLEAEVDYTVRAQDQNEANTLFQRAQPSIRQQGSQWVVLPAGDDDGGAVRADVVLTLPATLPVVIYSHDGDITIPSWHNALDLHTGHGSITAAHIEGNVLAASDHDTVSLDQVAGNVTITGGGDDVAISNVTGVTTLSGEFVGALSFRNLAGGLHFHSSRTTLDVAALTGTLTYDMGEISVSQAQGFTVATRDAQVEVRDFSGPLSVRTTNDSVRLASGAAPTQPITVSDRNADILLTLPAGSQFQLESEARNGSVDNEFGAAASGPRVHLATTNGTIRVRRTASQNQ